MALGFRGKNQLTTACSFDKTTALDESLAAPLTFGPDNRDVSQKLLPTPCLPTRNVGHQHHRKQWSWSSSCPLVCAQYLVALPSDDPPERQEIQGLHHQILLQALPNITDNLHHWRWSSHPTPTRAQCPLFHSQERQAEQNRHPKSPRAQKALLAALEDGLG